MASNKAAHLENVRSSDIYFKLTLTADLMHDLEERAQGRGLDLNELIAMVLSDFVEDTRPDEILEAIRAGWMDVLNGRLVDAREALAELDRELENQHGD
jgi:predicted transcriptional regulator